MSRRDYELCKTCQHVMFEHEHTAATLKDVTGAVIQQHYGRCLHVDTRLPRTSEEAIKTGSMRTLMSISCVCQKFAGG